MAVSSSHYTSVHPSTEFFSTMDSERLMKRLGQKDNETATEISRGRRLCIFPDQRGVSAGEERALRDLQEIRRFVGDTEQT